MKRSDLLSQIEKAAKTRGLAFNLEREGRSHSLYRCGDVRVTVPRHREINEFTAQGIMKDLEPVLGKGWWR